jgi:hypothetical protein
MFTRRTHDVFSGRKGHFGVDAACVDTRAEAWKHDSEKLARMIRAVERLFATQLAGHCGPKCL